ncbi:Glycosidase [Halogranum gelatinilyticum]|uniref:Glycosidase n=1 Tax=Halogranum gelatinilyticum TaxID=660521 RepID=A0A1G9Q3R1_9EURY|nr:alpha-amylase family glycosyl hydrolase [Halogranum gelatinilyticum]SDM05682.1 Glycosidase [Halogranum gelatinilyticum]
MHHPGPPRFTTVGEPVELAPRDPDPETHYRWTLASAPEASTVELGDGPVVHLDPDVSGTYVAELDAPDGTHRQTVRVFPATRKPAQLSVAADEVDGDLDGVESASVIGPFNDFTMGSHRVTREGDEWTLDVELPPGDHDAIFAFEDGFEPYARTEVTVDGAGRPRIRLDGCREAEEVVVTATAQPAPDGGGPDVEFHLDDRDALGESDVVVDGDELRVAVEDLPVLSRVHAVAVAERPSIADTLTIEVAADGSVGFDHPADAPEWVRDATVYQIFVREFAGETVDTTFEEIERRVPYLESLGVDTLWLTPVCGSPTRHGYHITDLFDTADDLGTQEEFESLVDRLHEAGIRVLFDLVVNHTSRDHPAFQLHRAGVPEYADYYERIPREQDTTGVDWAGEDSPGHYFNWASIPNVNYDSLAVRQWMLDVVDHWAPLVDGFRCDVAWGVPHGFWKEVRERVKADDPEFLLLDETVPRRVGFRENEFDLHYDTDLYFALRDIGTGDAPATAIFDALRASEAMGFPDEAVHMRYVENHDEDRYATECNDGTLRPAAAATFTLPGTPLVYYGQERGVPEQRGPMRWHDGDAALTAFHKRLVALRDEVPALRAREVDRVGCDVVGGDSEAVVAYERTDGEDDTVVVVVLNFADESATVALNRAVDTVDLFSGSDVNSDKGVRVDDVAVLRVD